MTPRELRTLLLKVFLGFLGASALLGIGSVLTQTMGALQLKVLGSSFAISSASICAMSCVAYVEQRGNKWLGGSGVALSALTLLTFLLGIWAEISEGEFWQVAFSLLVPSVGVAHALLLALPQLTSWARWVQAAAALNIATLAGMILVALWGQIGDAGYYAALAAVSIGVVFFSLAVPIVWKMGGPAPSDLSPGGAAAAAPGGAAEAPLAASGAGLGQSLTLTLRGDGFYADTAGLRYRVTRIFDEAEPLPEAAPPAALAAEPTTSEPRASEPRASEPAAPAAVDPPPAGESARDGA